MALEPGKGCKLGKAGWAQASQALGRSFLHQGVAVLCVQSSPPEFWPSSSQLELSSAAKPFITSTCPVQMLPCLERGPVARSRFWQGLPRCWCKLDRVHLPSLGSCSAMRCGFLFVLNQKSPDSLTTWVLSKTRIKKRELHRTIQSA